MAYEVWDSSFIEDDFDREDRLVSFPDLFDNKDGVLFWIFLFRSKLYLFYSPFPSTTTPYISCELTGA
jgi:hypothetical protein